VLLGIKKAENPTNALCGRVSGSVRGRGSFSCLGFHSHKTKEATATACHLAYAAAKELRVPLLYKGNDFAHIDLID
jgi:hypothetical protein